MKKLIATAIYFLSYILVVLILILSKQSENLIIITTLIYFILGLIGYITALVLLD